MSVNKSTPLSIRVRERRRPGADRDAASADQRVGYKNPPKDTRFKKGRSGNPKGRPKGAKGVAPTLFKVLSGKVAAKVDGRTVRISRVEGMCRRLVDKALAGDMRAIALLINLDPTAERMLSAVAHETMTALSEEDAAVLAIFYQSMPKPVEGAQ